MNLPLGVHSGGTPLDRLHLVSLYDMLRFYASAFAESVRCLETASATLLHPPETLKLKGMGTFVVRCTAEMDQALTTLPVSPSVRARLERLRDDALKVDLNDFDNRVDLATAIDEFETDIIIDLRDHLYLAVLAQRAEFYEQPAPLFGDEVEAVFPDAARDISAAGRCIALDEWTAAVFHLMRCLEHGLRNLATRLSLSFPSGIEVAQWQEIIERSEKAIKDLEQAMPKGTAKSQSLQFYSQAANEFRTFKNAWRNHVAHAKATYDEGEALRVFGSVKSFMQDLAAAPPVGSGP